MSYTMVYLFPPDADLAMLAIVIVGIAAVVGCAWMVYDRIKGPPT